MANRNFSSYSSSENGDWKPDDSDGDYDINHDAKTFKRRFFYINFLDRYGHYDDSYSECFQDDGRHARNKAKWYQRNKWALTEIPYQVVKISLYDSHSGHVEYFDLMD